jgi:hypothetical protein
MTVRRSLTPKQVTVMLAAQGGQCAKCRRPIGYQPDGSIVPFIAEHTVPVALGNTAKPDCLLCRPCADRKTNGSPATSYGSDKHAIAKTKRLEKKHAEAMQRILDKQLERVVIRPAKKPIPSRPLTDPHFRKRMNGKVEARNG